MKSALFAAVAYAILTIFLFQNNFELSQVQNMAMHLSFIAFSVVGTQLMVRKAMGDQPEFKRIWLYGWMSVVVLGVLTVIFYKLFYARTGQVMEIPGYYARLLITYNFFGLVISAMLAFFIRRL